MIYINFATFAGHGGRAVSARSETGTVGSNPTQGMDV
jgi:hypothetical protein